MTETLILGRGDMIKEIITEVMLPATGHFICPV